MLGGKGAYIRGSMTDQDFAKEAEPGRAHSTSKLTLTQAQATEVAKSLTRFDGSYYNVLTHNCTDPIQDGLRAAGLTLSHTVKPQALMDNLANQGLIKR